jgi:hypothetical protein
LIALAHLWAIWTARRKAIHAEIFQSSFAIFKFIENFHNELSSQGAKTQPRSMGTPQWLTASTWIPPICDHVKVNVDAVVARTGNRGVVAAICRSSVDGYFMVASALACMGISDPGTLESIACHETLALPSDLQISKYGIASDCQEVVFALKNFFCPSFSSVLCEIKKRSVEFVDVRFIHENRVYNGHAHDLARSSFDLVQGHRLWLLNPPDIVPLVIE